MPIVNNKKGGTAAIRVTANATYNVSDFALATETVTNLSITKIFHCGDWKISRGSNTVWVTTTGTGALTFDTFGQNLSEYSDASIVITTTNSANAALLLEVSKTSSFVSDYSKA